MKQMTFLDLCSGIGGFRLGLETAGHKCIGYCEYDKFARASYEAMYDTPKTSESRRTVSVCSLSQILEAEVDEKYYLSPEKTQQLLTSL